MSITYEDIRKLGDQCGRWKRLSPFDPQYLEEHRKYLELEAEYDRKVEEYFKETGKGKLKDGGYFK